MKMVKQFSQKKLNLILITNLIKKVLYFIKEVIEYARFLGIDPILEPNLVQLAYEGLKTPLPHPWKACKSNDDQIFYINMET